MKKAFSILLFSLGCLLVGCNRFSPYVKQTIDLKDPNRVCSEYELRRILPLEDYQRLEKKHSWIDHNGVRHPGFCLDYETGLIYDKRPFGTRN